ncbi:hypothetical protein RHSIM_Rhsim10G0190400 [Rhododendron simsii]|uniref:Uncharacterized protein n=1 Tax=Rhododendron simsii TaxID=118357 RepID=A0A834GAC7_RHOSS|nr:hypothetical protein RHSIM_Rhsim10G0190400 [Rhododendron simsii]
MNIMEIEEKQEFTSALPVLPRLDRLGRLLQLLEEKHNTNSEKHVPQPVQIRDTKEQEEEEEEGDKKCRTLSNALDEVHHKGTLMERLEMLEKRVLQLSLEIDEQNTSKSSTSSTVAVSEKLGNSSGLSSVTKDDQDVTSSTLEGRPDPLVVQEEKVYAQAPVTFLENRHNGRKQKSKPSRVWRRCFRVVEC